MAIKVYGYTERTAKGYFYSEPPRQNKAYAYTNKTYKTYLYTELKPNKVYLYTQTFKKAYLTTELPGVTKRYFFTPAEIKRYFFSEEFDTTAYPNICHYPKELDVIRQKATLLVWDEVNKKLYSSLNYEGWGKIDTSGYFSAGNVRLLLDYLSAIWLEKKNDSASGLARTSDYYYTKYQINDIIVNFRKCDINVKSAVALFNLNSYSVTDDEWPNYFMMDKVINPPDENTQKQMRQWTDIYTLQPVTPDRNQSIKTLSASQVTFLPTKNIKYFSAFTINGIDYTGYTDYNANSVTYSPSQLFGYNIEDNDTVIITYWYEE